MLRKKSENLNGTKKHLSGKGFASIAENASYLLCTSLFRYVVRFLYVIVLAHYLGPKSFGWINYGMSWYMIFLSFTDLGIPTILSREIGRDRSSGGWIASVTLTLRSSAAVFAAGASVIFCWLFESEPELRIILYIFSIALIGRSLAIWAQSIFTAYEMSKYAFRIQAIFGTFEVFAGTALLLAGGSMMPVVIIHAISWWLQALSGLSIVKRHLVAIWFNWSWHDVIKLFIKGLPLGFGGIVFYWFQMGPLVIFRFLSPSENSIGQLALAMQALIVLINLPVAIVAASLPIISRSVARQDRKEILFVETMMRSAFIFGGVVGLVGLGAGPWFVKILFGHRYLEAGYLIGPIIWLFIPFTCGCMISVVYLARGQFYLPTLCSGLGALIMTCLFPWLVSIMNALGAIIATGMGMWVWVLSLIWKFAKSDDLDFNRTVFRPLATVLFCLGGFFILKPVSGLFAMLLSCIALLCGSIVFGILTENEWDIFVNLKRRLSS